MGTLIRYLLAFALQIAWQRAGRGGATPPVRMPVGRSKGKTIPLPVIAPWQMMAAMWIARRIWTMYGGHVKSRLRDVNHPIAGQIHDLLPDTAATPTNASTPAMQQSSPTQTAQPATAPSATPPPASQPTPQYRTQPLGSAAGAANNGNSHATTKLPPGSILSGLRGSN